MKVLIVDDSSFILLVCRQALERSGYEVVGEAEDGASAVEIAEQTRPDFVIMDIALPKKNGFEATQMIHEVLPKAKVLAISAVDEDWIRDKAIASGCFDFLPKPFDTVTLISLLDDAKDSQGDLKYG
jgi:two-component system chemotaxis response regulator CheY